MIMTTKQSPRLLLELVELVDEPHGPDQLQQPAEAQRLRAAAAAGGGGRIRRRPTAMDYFLAAIAGDR